MLYITKNDDISVLPLSVRSKNCLRSEAVHTIGAMMDYPAEKLINIRSMGKKSVEEIQSFVRALNEGTGEFVLVETGDGSVADTTFLQKNKDGVMAIFIDETGAVVQDIPVKDLPLSVRARNSLSHEGFEFASQLLGVTFDELMNLKNMGKKTAEEVLAYIEKIPIEHKPGTIPSVYSLAAEMCAAYGEKESEWLRVILVVKAQFPDATGESLIYRLYERAFVRDKVKAKILKMIEGNGDEVSKTTLENRLPRHLRNTTILEEILIELESASAVETGEVMIYRQYPSVVQYISQMTRDRERELLQARLDGKTLQEIGDQYGITRERVRQLTRKELKNKPYLREDKYAYLYDHYDFSFDDFLLSFDEPKETYYYLEMVCHTHRARKKPLEEILADAAIAPELRKKAERAIYKRYVSANGVLVKMARPNLVRQYIKVNCRKLTKFDTFVSEYNLWLDSLGLGDNASLAIDSREGRSYENHLNNRDCDYVLWNQGHSFRYYNISEYDFGELLSSLDLGQFEDTELSTLRIFRDYPELMQQYDIRDEYELHNLLKKIWPAENNNVKFKKMPTIEVGNADRHNQVLSLLLQYAPVTAEDLANHYEEAYGVKAMTVRANYFPELDHYYYQGSYSVDFSALSDIQFNRMKSVLDCDFYTIQEVKRLYRREFPHSDESLINPYTLKMLDFRVYSGYVIKNTYATATDYFHHLLTSDDIVDARTISRSIQNVIAYGSELHRLRAEYEIIEFSPQQYIHIRRLNASGISIDDLVNYSNAVALNYEKGDYFTVTSLRQDGFTHEMDEFGFDEWFYSSVLLEERTLFSYQRIGGTRIFLRGKTGANLGGMLVWLLGKYQKIDFYDLMDLLENHYGISVPKEKLLRIIDGTELYFDSIMEAVYIDYDTYFEEL